MGVFIGGVKMAEDLTLNPKDPRIRLYTLKCPEDAVKEMEK